MQRAELAQDAGDLEEARQAVEEGLALDPKNTDFRSLQIVLDRELAGRDKQKKVQEFLGEARKEISSRRFTGALEVLRKAESLDPSASVVQELIVLASTGQQQEKRRQELERLTAQIEEAMAKEDYKTAAARIEEGLRSYPDDRGLLKLQAVVRKQQEDTEKSRYVERQTSQARRLLDGGQAADALSLLQSAIERYPAEPSIQAMLAMVQQNIDRTGKEQEKTEVIQAARDAIRRKAYSIAIAILEAARKKATSNEYDELLQFAQNEGENKAKRQKIDAVAEEARRLTSEDKYAEAIALLKATLQEIPDQELEIVLADFERHVGELNDGVEKSVATVERLLRQDRYAEAIKLLEGQSARFANSPKFRETLRNVRERQRAVRVVSELKEEVRNALSAGDMARAQVLCQEFRKTDNAPDIALVEKEIEARRSEAANAQLETALRDARLLITVQSPGAAMSVLESIESVVPFAGPDLRQRFVGLKTAAENAQRQAMQRAGIPAPAGRAAIESAEETQIADPDHLQSMLAEVSLIATNYRDDEKVQSAIYSVKQKLSDRIQVLRESSVQNLTTPPQGASPALPVNTATSLTPLVQENKPWGSTRLAHLPTPPSVAKPAGPTDSPPAPPQPVTGGKRIPAQSAQSAKIPAGQTLPRIGVPPIPVRPPHGEAPGVRQRVERLPGTVSRQFTGGVLGKIILAVAVVVVLSAIWALRRGKTTSPPPPAPSQKLISMSIHTSPPGATITVDNEVRGISDLQLNLMAGKYRLQADLSGYLPAKASLEVKSGSPNSIDLTLQPAMPTVKLSSDTGVGRVVLDNLPPIDLAGEQRTLDGVAAGNHKLNFESPQGNASFSFSTGAGTLPIVTSPITATRLVAVVAASRSSLVHVYCSQPNVDASLDDQPSAKLSREGLELAGVSGGRHQLLIKDGGNQYRMEINVGPIPALTTFLQSGRITGNLVVITREDGVRVSVDGIAQRALTGGGQMRIPNLDPKEYSIAVSKPGFQPVPSQSTLIRKGEQTTLSFILTPVPRVASLSIRGGPPGGQVFVDDKLAGALLPDGTSTLKNISPGDHTIVLRRDMFEPKRLQKRFVAGSEVVITGTEAALQLATGELRITFSPPDALATVAKAGESPIKVTNGTALKLPPGTYTVAARIADDMTSAKTVEVAAGQSRSVNLSLAANGMSKWEEPSGWKAEQNVFVHRGGGFVLFGTAPTTGVFSFSVELQKGKRLQWFLNYTTPRNYVLFQMDENYFYRSTMRNGEATVEIKTPHKIHKGAFQSIRVRVTPDEILTQIKEGTSWFDLDKWSSIGTNLAQGKFGFYLPGKDQIAMMNFNHYPDLDIR
jgi:PEGA domain